MSNNKTTLGIGENLEGALAYFLLFISGIFLLIMEKENRFVRFHAMQSTLVFVPLAIISLIAGYIPLIGGLLTVLVSLVSLALWLWLMYKAFNHELYKLPIIGDIAEKQLNS